METITIEKRTHQMLANVARRRGTSVEEAIVFLVTKQLSEEGVPTAPGALKKTELPAFECPHTHEQFARWLGVSIETVKRMSKRTKGRLTVGSGGRCVRWHIPTYLASLR